MAAAVQRKAIEDELQRFTSSLPLEVAFPKQVHEEETKVAVKLYAELVAMLVARSSRGKLLELESVDHEDLLREGSLLDRMVVRIKQLALADAPLRKTEHTDSCA
jgi:hypothetical protein